MRHFMFCLVVLSLVAFAGPKPLHAQTDQSDRGFVQGLLEDALSAPGRTVRMEGFAGALSSRATIDKITVTDPEGVWLTASDLVLVWNRSALLRGEVDIDEITIGEIDLPRRPVPAETPLPAPEASGAFALPELPVSVNIAKMEITKAVLGKALFGEAAEVSFSGKAALASGAGSVTLAVKRLDRAGTFSLTGAFDNATRVLDFDLNLTEPEDGIAANLLNLPGKPPVVLSVQGKDPVSDFNATIRLSTDGKERLSGKVELTTAQDGATRFSTDLQGDVAPVVAPQFAAFLGDDVALVASGERAADGDLLLDKLHVKTAAMQIGGSAEIGADGWPRKLLLNAQITPPAGDSVILPLPGPQVSVQEADFSAQFDAAAGDSWRIDGRADGVDVGTSRVKVATFAGEGKILRDAQSVTGGLQLDLDGLAPSDPAMAQAVGKRMHGALRFGWSAGAPLRVRDLALSGVDYGLSGVLSVANLDNIAALTILPDVTLEARDLSRFAGLVGLDLAGGAELAIRGQVAPLTGALSLNFDGTTRDVAVGVARLDPLLAGEGALRLHLERDTDGLRVDPLTISTKQARIDATAKLSRAGSTLSARASVPDVSQALPGMSGAATLSAQVDQKVDGWHVKLSSDLPGKTQAGFQGVITGDGVKQLRAEGTLSADVGQLSVFSDLAGRRLGGAVSLSAQGKADLLARSFDVTATGETRGLDFGVPTLTPLLRGTVGFEASIGRDAQGVVAIRELTASGPAANAALSGSFGPGEGRLEYRLGVGNLGVVIPDLPGPARVSGTAVMRGGPWQIDATGTGPGGIAFNTSGQVAADGATVNVGLTGTVPLALGNARLSGQALSGLARVDLRVNGPPALRSVSGRVTVVDGRLAIPARNLSLNGIGGQVSISAGTAQVSLGADVSSGGRVALSGPISVAAPYNATLVTVLQSVTLREAQLFEANLTGRVTFDGPLLGGGRIGGAITLQSAEMHIPQFGPSYSALEGLRHLNPSRKVRRTLHFAGLDKPATQAASLPGYAIDLSIRAPNQLFVRGRGLDAELGGRLRLTGTTNNIVPVGALNLIRGRLDLLGRRLDLTEGSVRLRGSFDPVIAFAATSQVDDVAVSLRLEGVASAPELTVTSVPDLPQDDALSYFLFGRDATQISAYQAIQLAAAIRTLSGHGGGFSDKLRKGLGVDDLDIGVDAAGTPQARVGKYISDNIYTDVTVNADGVSQINLNLEISRTVKMRGRVGSDGDSGLGVYFEKDY